MSRFEWWYSHSSRATGRRDIRRNVKWRSDKNANLMTFCQLTRHPVVIEEWKYHHSNRPIETSRMVVFPFFYNHWMPRYSNGAGTKMPILRRFVEYLGLQWS